MRSQLKLIKKQYNIAVRKWEEDLYRKEYRSCKSVYHKDNTGYQITPFNYYIDIIRTLYKKFGIKPEQFKDMSLIDLGCGYGGMLRILYPYFKQVRGIEYNPLLVEYCKNIFNNKIDIQQGDVKDAKCSEDIIYTFNITQNKSIFLPILENMTKNQIFIESWDSDEIVHYARALKFSKIEEMGCHGVIIQK